MNLIPDDLRIIIFVNVSKIFKEVIALLKNAFGKTYINHMNYFFEEWFEKNEFQQTMLDSYFVRKNSEENIKLVKFLMNNNKILKDINIGKLFCYICMFDESFVVKYLIDHEEKRHNNIDIHTENEKVFKCACDTGHISTVKYLIWLGENGYGKIDIHTESEKAFQYACCIENINTAKYLVWLGENGYDRINIHIFDDDEDYDEEYLFASACRRDNIKIAKYLVWLGENGYGKIDIHCNGDETAFISACSEGHTEVVKYLIWLGENGYGKIDINTSDDTEDSFSLACWNCHFDIVKYLIWLGENGYERNEFLDGLFIFETMFIKKGLSYISYAKYLLKHKILTKNDIIYISNSKGIKTDYVKEALRILATKSFAIEENLTARKKYPTTYNMTIQEMFGIR